MRLAAQMRGGYYPAHEKAVPHAASFLRPPPGKGYSLLDPCAGEGAAVVQVSQILGCPSNHTYAIELDDSRAQTLRAALLDGHVLAPASFFGCRATPNSFSFVWLNPPFDHAYGGHRVEEQFLRQATDWLMPGGVLAFVCPEDVIGEFSDAREHFATYFRDCKIVPFPEECRPFKEVVVFAHKRSRPHADKSNAETPKLWDSVQATEGFIYQIPASPGPKVFTKVEPTESELQSLLAKSPLRTHLTAPSEAPLPSRG